MFYCSLKVYRSMWKVRGRLCPQWLRRIWGNPHYPLLFWPWLSSHIEAGKPRQSITPCSHAGKNTLRFLSQFIFYMACLVWSANLFWQMFDINANDILPCILSGRCKDYLCVRITCSSQTLILSQIIDNMSVSQPALLPWRKCRRCHCPISRQQGRRDQGCCLQLSFGFALDLWTCMNACATCVVVCAVSPGYAVVAL